MRGLPRIGTFLRDRHLAEILLYDGIVGMPKKEEILSRIYKETPDFVGFYTNIINYPTALEMAEKLKVKYNPRIILGGPWVSLEGIAYKTLSRREFIDFVCVGQGEHTFEGLLNDNPLNSIPNLVWRNKNNIVHNIAKINLLSELPKPAMELLNIELYKQLALKMGFEPTMTLQAFSGCPGKCTFCIRETGRIDSVPPLEYITEIEKLYEQFRVKHFWDISATFTSNNSWLEEFVKIMKQKPRQFTISAYARVNEITIDKADLLNEANVSELFIGFESGDNELLKKVRKGITRNKSIEATKILTERGIKVLGAFMTGLPGENLGSLKKTYDLAKRIYEDGKENVIYSSIIMPFPGSIIYKELLVRLRNEANQGFLDSKEELERVSGDIIDPNQLKYSWTKRFCNVSLETIQEYATKIAAISGLSTSFININYEPFREQNGI